MIARLFTRDISLVFAASFFYMSCSFIATPLIAGFSESLGAGAVFMGIIGATFNTVALLYGYVPLAWFYPILALTVPAAIGVYLVSRKRFHRI